MASRITVTNTYHTAEDLQDHARKCNSGRHAQRLQAVALRIKGQKPSNVAEKTGTTAQSVRDCC